MKILDFFTKKKTYEWIHGHTYEETEFQHWLCNSWIYSVYVWLDNIKDFSFKYDFLYKKIYLRLQNKLAVSFDSWSLDNNFIDYLIPRILWLKEHKNGVSVQILEECAEKGIISNNYRNLSNDDIEKAYKYQQEILFDIAKGLACNHIIENTFPTSEKLIELENKINEAFDLIKKYRTILWD